MDISNLTAYQVSVYIGLTEVVHPEYSNVEALALIEKHKDMIAEREGRRFDPYATARAIQEATKGAAAQFTFFWLDGKREVLEGADSADALNRAGYGAGAVRALDFYAHGDNDNHVWDTRTGGWERRAETDHG